MFNSLQLSTTLGIDRQTRLRGVASRHRLARRNKAPSAVIPAAVLHSLVRLDDADPLATQQRVHCAA